MTCLIGPSRCLLEVFFSVKLVSLRRTTPARRSPNHDTHSDIHTTPLQLAGALDACSNFIDRLARQQGADYRVIANGIALDDTFGSCRSGVICTRMFVNNDLHGHMYVPKLQAW